MIDLADLVEMLSAPAAPPFAVLHRAGGPGVEILLGEVVDVDRLDDIPLPACRPGAACPQVLALVPYRQVVERGFTCHDDHQPLRCLVVREQRIVDLADALALLPDQPVTVSDGGFDVDDAAYADIVRAVIRQEIGRGEGANFVIRRDFVAHVDGPVTRVALTLLRRLLVGEPGAYWTFAVHAGDTTMVGATPERHVSVNDGTVLMNPISGTYRYPSAGPTREGLLRFLADPKENEELFMVVDEELKMMSEVCDRGGRVLGPFLKEMGHLAHTEYLLAGRTGLDVRAVLRQTMFAPTVTGSPVENAARVIARHETTGRGYYSGVAALIGQDAAGRRTLDAPILIRTAYLDPLGSVRLPVGATLVRDSVPEQEAAETHAKVAGVLSALGVVPARAASPRAGRLVDLPGVAQALAARNDTLAPFWLEAQSDQAVAELTGRSALIADAEDRWTSMLAHLLRRMGMTATVQRWTDVADAEADAADLLVAGPGPGDPRNFDDPRIVRLRRLIGARLDDGRPLLAVCLSHQILAGLLGLTVDVLPHPYQGTQRTVDLFGRPVRMGFYNTFAARAAAVPGVEVAAEPDGEVHALRGPGFAAVQFHLESVLSPDGVEVLASLATGALAPRQRLGTTPLS